MTSYKPTLFSRSKTPPTYSKLDSLVQAFMSAFGRIWHPHIVTIDLAAGPSLIDIELLKSDWQPNIKPYLNPRYSGATVH